MTQPKKKQTIDVGHPPDKSLPFTIIICGSRTFTNYKIFKNVADYVFCLYQYNEWFHDPKTVELVHGDARGADLLGARWGTEYGMTVRAFPARWDCLNVDNVLIKKNSRGEYNALAGINRNQEMLEHVVIRSGNAVILAFYKGASRGSKDMVRISKKAGVIHHIWDDDKWKLRK